MEQLFPHITCGVCSKPYNDPRILTCLHSCLDLEEEIGRTDEYSEKIQLVLTIGKALTTPPVTSPHSGGP